MEQTRPLNGKAVDERGTCVLYWMQNSQRADDNPALNEAIQRANAAGVPVAVFFGLTPGYPGATARSYAFLLDGLRETESRLRDAGIPLVIRLCSPDHGIEALCAELRPREVIVDGAVLRLPRRWRSSAAQALAVPLTEVWSDTVIPPTAFGRLAAGAYSLRPFLNGALDGVNWDVARPEVRHRWSEPPVSALPLKESPTPEILLALGADSAVPPVRRFIPGWVAATAALERFAEDGLGRYDEDRNRAERDGTSRISPYLHFGQIGPHTIVRAVRSCGTPKEGPDPFLEQLLVRRELSWNFAYYEPAYDAFEGLPDWGRVTLLNSSSDPRPVLYTREQFEASETHDDVWNAANREMVETGWMHNYMRMLWAKKILEWSETPQEAFDTAVYLNDRYQLDGRDPNGYTGIAWSIGGRHDRPWPGRPVFGAIRYMSSDAARRKMDIPAYIRKVEQLAAAERTTG